MTPLLALVLVPALGALGAALHRADAYRTTWLVGTAALHLALTGVVWASPPAPALGGWLALDATGALVLGVVSVLFAVTAVYTVGYLRRESPRGGRAFVGCLLAFLTAATVVALSHQLALLWVGLESTTLAVAPLIYHRHDRRSLEAVWKYLVLSSVGIALALLGTFLLSAAQSSVADSGRPLMLEDLVAAAPRLHPAWLKAACVFLLVGFGAKMGLVPLHMWKPDAYGEAPSLVGGLMAGALTTCAFLGLLRMTQVAAAAGLGWFVAPLYLVFGLGSIVVATAFLIAQRDLRRLLAYSSVEHMGLLTLGIGLGGGGSYGSLLHLVTNGLAKGLLFLTAGNVLLARGAGGRGEEPRGLLRTLPASAAILVIGLFAVTGSPPFGTFLSEFAIVRGAFTQGHPWVGGTTLLLLAIAFVGIARLIAGMVFGPPAAAAVAATPERESGWLLAGPIVLAAGLLALGLMIPDALQQRLSEAATTLHWRAP